ncbi:hypothetical protein [Botrimarina hoheduenensis]|uniref:Vitamin K-dependent gamma-carboxylase n=1 Tax=Botrimarina hoheduenensis TaxID=2528000 RepID=A0A5C5WE53_9BACT|nr:hypothetical protein [Botrimarina hoheduenensis]TWT48747.1 hypothetical protein Pla111_05220 [Botrimarina hoheduenensis]
MTLGSVISSATDLDPPPRQLVLAWAATLAALIAVTYPLWVPGREVPTVVPHVALVGATAAASFAGLLLIAWGGIGSLLSSRRSRGKIAAVLTGLCLFAAVDELRWQAWAYHALVVGTFLWLATPSTALQLTRWLAVGIYGYSAIAKLDVVFADTLGQQMLIALGDPVGIPIESLSVTARRAAALALPVAELAIAGALGAAIRWPRLRPYGIAFTVLQHALTIGLLGPWALDHGWGVLIWNVGFATQTAVAFLTIDRPANHSASLSTTTRRFTPDGVATALCGLVLITPLAYAAGYGDAWLNAAFYAPRGERATVFVQRDAVERLPQTLRQYVDNNDEPWQRLRLSDWVLSDTEAPLPPQNRHDAALAIAIGQRFALSERLRVVAEGPANRLTGGRASTTLTGEEAIRPAACGRTAVWP